MAGRVIQGFFLGGQFRPRATVAQPKAAMSPPRAGPPAPAFAGPAHPAKPQGGSGSFTIDPVQLGLARSGSGKPMSGALLAKMEAAFDADFSSVRVHVGAQASRIGAVAFTTGNDLYFAPGRYQPDSVQGQQLIGHELAHVIQQRQGRVRAQGNGVSVVQDRALEAEADRLGQHAAMYRAPPRTGVTMQPKLWHKPVPWAGAILQRSSSSSAPSTQSTSVTLTIGGLAYPGKTGKSKGHAEMQALDDFLDKIRDDMKSNPEFDSHTTSQLDEAVFKEARNIIGAGPNSVDCSAKAVCVSCSIILQKLGFAADTGTVFGDKKSNAPDWNVTTRVRDFLKFLKLGATLSEAVEAGKSK